MTHTADTTSTRDAWPQIENPVTGDRMVIMRTAEATGGACLEVQFDLPPGAAGSPLHYHRHITETFEVSSGSLEMLIQGAVRTLTPGEIVAIPPRTPHAFRNASADWVTFTSAITPAGQFERFLRSWYGLARAGLVTPSGVPRNPLYLALGLDYADFAFPGVPDRLQRVFVRALAGLGRLTGAERRLDGHMASGVTASP